MTMSPDPAALLARRLADADPDARRELAGEVDRLLAAHQDVVYAACLHWVGSPEQARELAQDTLLLAFRKLPTFRGDARFRTWLLAIARYTCNNARRKRADALTEDGVLDATDPAASAFRRLRLEERDALLHAAAAAVLDDVEQEAIHLRYVEQVPVEQITTLLGLDSASGARGLLQRCTRKLRRELTRQLAELGHGTSLVFGSQAS
jgi:RNA polymerase sigma-70 factor (ECF subfamily)